MLGVCGINVMDDKLNLYRFPISFKNDWKGTHVLLLKMDIVIATSKIIPMSDE